MPEHKFKIGERLFPGRSCELNVSNGAYVIVKRLPMRAGEFEYQIRSLTGPDERVVRESQLRSNSLGNRLGRSARTSVATLSNFGRPISE
jgi:hypothetical protein